MEASRKKAVTLGHSPDPDDAFMFYALARNLIPTDGWTFHHVLQDIQTLNERATRGELDISAISFHAYPFVRQHYVLLPCGASMGDGYGPCVVAREVFTAAELARKTILIPGKMTSAFLALQLWLGRPARELKCEVAPFDRIIHEVQGGRADAGLIIHEGQLTYARDGLKLCADLGQWWKERTAGLPLPLGGNVLHKKFGAEARSFLAALLRQSIEYSLAHRAEAVEYAVPFGRDLDRPLADRFIGMYVNDWTLDLGPRGWESLRRFFAEAAAMKLIPDMEERLMEERLKSEG